MACYLLKFNQPAGDPTRPGAFAEYYLGFSADCPTHRNLLRRILSHAEGTWIEWSLYPLRQPPALPRWFFERGIGFRVARVWLGRSRKFERRLKRNGHYKRHDLVYRSERGLPLTSINADELALIAEANQRLRCVGTNIRTLPVVAESSFALAA